MGRIIFVRHGQASFLTDDYDRLSELGQEQSRQLGDFWARNKTVFTRAVAGPRRRHMETADQVIAAYRAVGSTFPSVERDPALDEFDWDGLMAHAKSHLLENHKDLRALHDAFLQAPDRNGKRRAIQKYMEALMVLWVSDAFSSPDVETWAAFCARVYGTVDRLVAEAGSGASVAVFSSGGTAAVAVQKALDQAPSRTLELIWTLRNAAMVEFLFTRDRFSLASFNDVPHLSDPASWSYR